MGERASLFYKGAQAVPIRPTGEGRYGTKDFRSLEATISNRGHRILTFLINVPSYKLVKCL
jgi:hypothetical protein